MSEQEEWRPVVGFPDYMVSDQGRVLSYRRKTPRLMALSPGKVGYPLVKLFAGPANRSADVKAIWVHQLVAAAFHGPRPEGMEEIRHLDGDKLNNRANNLCYGTRSENQRDRLRHGTHHFANRTHCKHGHLFDEENTYRIPSSPGARLCRACRRDRRRNAPARSAA
jgi:hypothetical protein